MDTTENIVTDRDGKRFSVAIDTGGTFTDIALVNRDTGSIWKGKVASTPLDPSQGFIAGIGAILDESEVPSQALSHVFHGTTVATNAILESKGARAGLITTAGFRHVLEIGRHDVPRTANMYSWQKPQRPVPPERIFEVEERIEADGSVTLPLDERSVRHAIEQCRAAGVSAIAVCLIHSYTNPSHERRIADILAEEYPEAELSLSSGVLPVFREYERSMAAILNAYVKPLVGSYVSRLESRLNDEAIDARLMLMKSSGGVTGADTIRELPVHTGLSGPAAGVVGAIWEGALVDEHRLITLDMGGTSADICLIEDGEPVLTIEGSIGEWPLRLPMLDIHTIGAGGGSVARVDASAGLMVGPESAGAEPGPVAYGRGGTEPTVTDAHVVLGHLPKALLSGALPIDREGAVAAIERQIARPLGLGLEEAASGILAVANNNMVGAIRVVSVERGHDPRQFTLVPFGGAGPLHASFLMQLMGLPSAMIPPSPGVLSAQGLLVSSLRNEFSRTCLQQAPRYDLAQMAGVFDELNASAAHWFEAEGIPASGRNYKWSAGMRYLHQGFELLVPWPRGEVSQEVIDEVIAAFHEEHRRLYTFSQPDTPVEIVNLLVEAVGELPRPNAYPLPEHDTTVDAVIGIQPMWISGAGWLDCPILDRARLGAGAEVHGPAIITQLDCTTTLLEGDVAKVHRYGSLILRRADKDAN